jgi:tetratricopeptide (TPR) repeat protein
MRISSIRSVNALRVQLACRPHTVKRKAAETDVHSTSTSSSLISDYITEQAILDKALVFSRLERFDEARDTFSTYLRHQPLHCKAWVMWAQMEKRAEKFTKDSGGSSLRAREILKKGLEINKGSACLITAWGLTELKSGNVYAAKRMLQRAAQIDPSISPVLRWDPVRRLQ